MRWLQLLTVASTALAGLCEDMLHDGQEAVNGDASLSPEGHQPTTAPSSKPQESESSETETTYSGSAKAVDCLTAFNEARNAAGLPSFVSAGEEFRVKDPKADNGKFFSDVCQALMTETPIQSVDPTFNRTIALAIQDGEDGDCAAAVTHFNGALSLFGSLPPAFSTDAGSVYKKLQAVSFVALYNPKENPKLDCGYFTCTKTVTQTTSKAPTDEVDVGTHVKAEAPSESTAITTTLHGLLCATSPPALIAGQAPFEQEQYDKIKGAVNSTSTAAPALLTLAMAGAGLIFFQ